jgi:hypothetical protein
MIAVTEAELTASQIADLRLASSQMRGAARRRFQAEMTLKYCDGSARKVGSVVICRSAFPTRPDI